MTKKIKSKIKSIQSNLIQDLSNKETDKISGGAPAENPDTDSN